MKELSKVMALLLAVAVLFSVSAPFVRAEEEAEQDEDAAAQAELEEVVDLSEDAEAGKITSMVTMANTPATWNPHTQQDEADGELMDYLTSPMFEFDYAEGSWTTGYEILPYMVSELPTDVTAEYAGDEKWGIPADATEGYAHKYVLRDDLVWEDGTPINADSFVYSVKELLNPKMLNHRADMLYSGAQVVHNAENYIKQGSTQAMTLDKYAALQGYEDVDAFLAENGDMPAMVNWNYSFGEIYKDGEWSNEDVENKYVDAGMSVSELRDLFLAKVRDEWGEKEESALKFFETEAAVSYDYPEMDFSEVGFQKTGDLEFVVIKDKPLVGFDFYWNCRRFDLVYPPYYEAAKTENPDSDIITTNYATKVENTMSYGAYKLVGFQDDKFFDLVRNENWFGWNVERLSEKNQEDRVYYQIVKEPTTRYQMFLKGQLNNYSLQPDEVDEYRGSDFIIYTPQQYTEILNIQAQEKALEAREEEGVCRRILTIPEFRQALAWSIDRAAYAESVTTSSFPGFGLIGMLYVADPETMTPYRNYEVAKETLLDAYGVEYGEGKDFASLDEAYLALTGYDLDAARQLFDEAYDKAVEKGFMHDGDVVKMKFSFSQDNESTQRTFNYLNETWTNAVQGTKLEDKLVVEYDPTAGNQYADNFKNGQSDLLLAGWVGAVMDPFYYISCYLNPDYRYDQAYNPDAGKIEHEINGTTYALSAQAWWDAMMGLDAKHPFGKSDLDQEQRIEILALIEKDILSVYTAVPLCFTTKAQLISQRIELESPDYEYHPILGYGHTIYNFDDLDWDNYVQESNGTLDYH